MNSKCNYETLSEPPVALPRAAAAHGQARPAAAEQPQPQINTNCNIWIDSIDLLEQCSI